MSDTRTGEFYPCADSPFGSAPPLRNLNLFETAEYSGSPLAEGVLVYANMTTPGHACATPHCSFEIPVDLETEGLCLQHYLEKAFHNLATATLDFQCGRDIDDRAMEWLLSQVNFAVESLGQEDAPWTAEQRSLLLELILGIANLNEFMRHSKMVTGPAR